jgi:alginate O-acetyltransferase complex protein AlgI
MEEKILHSLRDVLTYNPDAPMIFSSGLFLMLFLGFAFVYMALKSKTTARLFFVTLFSYYFYYKSSGLYFVILAVVTCSDFAIAKCMGRWLQSHPGDKRRMRWLVLLSLVIDLGFLFYFKYTNFFGGMLSDIIGRNFQPYDIFLPVGISFFTFQSMSYTIDVYRGDIRALDSLLDYAFYVSFFPQLVAGPIVRARDFVPQIRQPLVITNEMFSRGVYFIIIGLFKKAVISDYISLNFVDRIFDNPQLYSGMENLLGVYGYALQIYCDFSGYSDMAIGIALLLGFRFPINFNAPYTSISITDFWRRWHISLSTWIRDYIYISLGGNRKGKVRTYVNLLITMLLGGLWHGASLNFVAWGGMHGLALAGHKFLSQNILHHDKHYRSRGWRRVLSVVITFHFVCLAWIFFRNNTFAASGVMIGRIFSAFHPELFLQVVLGYWQVFALIAFGYLSHWLPDSWQEWFISRLSRMNIIVYAFLIVVVIYIVIQIKSSDIQPFIYFQF